MSEEKPTAAPVTHGARLAKLSSPWFIWPATVALAVLLFFGLGYFFDVLTHESTDDAFITADVASIAPRVAGQIAIVHVINNEMVHSNEILVEIDPADYSEFQPEFLALRLLPKVDEIRSAEVPILKTTHLVYNEIEKEILMLIQNHPNLLSKFPVYVLGGIVINTDETLPNYFSQKTFKKIS